MHALASSQSRKWTHPTPRAVLLPCPGGFLLLSPLPEFLGEEDDSPLQQHRGKDVDDVLLRQIFEERGKVHVFEAGIRGPRQFDVLRRKLCEPTAKWRKHPAGQAASAEPV